MNKKTITIILAVVGLVVIYFVFFKNKDKKESSYKGGGTEDTCDSLGYGNSCSTLTDCGPDSYCKTVNENLKCCAYFMRANKKSKSLF